MIITKEVGQITGYIEYSYGCGSTDRRAYDVNDEEQSMMFESDTFDSLEDLLEKMKPEVLEEIKKDYDADLVWISAIKFYSKSEDGEIVTDISLYENKKVKGFIRTEINNDDITNRAVSNLKQVKRIVDNTLHEFPIKFSRD